MEIMATCILSLLSACSYLLPVSFFLPCRLSKKEKGILFLIFLGYSPDPVETGKYWRGCAAPFGRTLYCMDR